MMARLTALACVLASLQAVGGNQLGDLSKMVTQLNSAAVNADNGRPLQGETPGGSSASGASNLFSLLSGGATAMPKPETPQPPNTLIRYTPGEKPGEEGRCDLVQVPHDARMIVVDGRVQICCPKGKATKGR
jgi:hypothetical protein